MTKSIFEYSFAVILVLMLTFIMGPGLDVLFDHIDHFIRWVLE